MRKDIGECKRKINKRKKPEVERQENPEGKTFGLNRRQYPIMKGSP